jgi:hypothetical protein
MCGIYRILKAEKLVYDETLHKTAPKRPPVPPSSSGRTCLQTGPLHPIQKYDISGDASLHQQSHLQSHICLHQNFNRKVNYQISPGSKIMICMWKEWEWCLKSLQLMCLCRTHLQSLETWSNPLFGTNFFHIPVILAHVPHKCSPIIPPLNLPQEKRMALLRFACCSTSYWIMFNTQTAHMS